MPKSKPASKAAEPAKMGRPPFEPTDKNRGEVHALTVVGFTQTQIADYLDIDEKTLRLHFRVELDFALMTVLANCASNVVRLANGVPAEYDAKGNKVREEIPMSLGPNAFILKTRGKTMGWTERLEVTGAGGGAVEHRHETVDEVRNMIAEETAKGGIQPTKH